MAADDRHRSRHPDLEAYTKTLEPERGLARMIANKDGGVSSATDEPVAAPRDADNILSEAGLNHAIDSSRRWLLDRQDPSGFWVGELEGDSILESEYVLLMAFMGRGGAEVCVKACRYIKDQQGDEGGWAIYPGGVPDLSASVKAYFALKIVGVPFDDPSMVRARSWILQAGGARGCNSFTRFYLALLGQISYDECPSVPPELLLIPSRWPFSLSAMSAWTRTIVVPLSILSAYKPVRKLPSSQGITELFSNETTGQDRGPSKRWLSWSSVFQGLDRGLKWADRTLPRSWRKPGLRAAHRWMLDHFENSDGLGAIFPPMIYSVVALHCLGYEKDSAEMHWAYRQLDELLIEEEGKVRIQPCVSPVWDTAISALALSDASTPEVLPALQKSTRWLLEKEVRSAGDWQVRRPGIEPSGWHFQHQNERYPDIDDTAMVLLALQRSSSADPADQSDVKDATRRGVHWLLSMQNKDGGWAAFDVDIDNEILTQVPFADHNAMLDPSCADITARVLECLGTLGYQQDHPAVAKALKYLWKTQEPEGSWYGRWGVNYLYGTWQVLQGLKALGVPMTHPRLRKAADWLESVQQPCGAWGESCRSYDDRAWMARGEASASQTAWALLGLVAAGRAQGKAASLAVEYLRNTQNEEGTWDEATFTGTGFPRVFYLKYHLYRVYFPLMALARYREAVLPSDSARLAGQALDTPISRTPEPPRPLEV